MHRNKIYKIHDLKCGLIIMFCKVNFFVSSKLSDYNLVFMAMNFNDDNEQTKNT